MTSLPTHTESNQSPPKPASPRFVLELEFVLSLSNPRYLSYLAATHPHLLNFRHNSSSDDEDSDNDNSELRSNRDAVAFANYLAYLYNYWKTPEYVRFLTHPGATLRALRLLQEERFRREIIRPDVVQGLLYSQEEFGVENGIVQAEHDAADAEQAGEKRNGLVNGAS